MSDHGVDFNERLGLQCLTLARSNQPLEVEVQCIVSTSCIAKNIRDFGTKELQGIKYLDSMLLINDAGITNIRIWLPSDNDVINGLQVGGMLRKVKHAH